VKPVRSFASSRLCEKFSAILHIQPQRALRPCVKLKTGVTLLTKVHHRDSEKSAAGVLSRKYQVLSRKRQEPGRIHIGSLRLPRVFAVKSSLKLHVIPDGANDLYVVIS
jgi:hypothetical protein